MRQIIVRAEWDPEVSVWVATSDEIPLVTEAETVEGLVSKLPGIIADLTEAEGCLEVPFELVAHHFSTVSLRKSA